MFDIFLFNEHLLDNAKQMLKRASYRKLSN